MVFTSSRPSLNLTDDEIQYLNDIIKSSHSDRIRKRAKIISLYLRNFSISRIANECSVSRPLVTRVIDKTLNDGIQNAIFDRPRSGRPKVSKD